MNRPFTLMTWNVNGIRARLDDVLAFLAEKNPDIACLQETKCEDKAFPRFAFAELGYTVLRVCPRELGRHPRRVLRRVRAALRPAGW